MESKPIPVETIDYCWELLDFNRRCEFAKLKKSLIKLSTQLPQSGCGSLWELFIEETVRNNFQFAIRKQSSCGRVEFVEMELYVQGLSRYTEIYGQFPKVSHPMTLVKESSVIPLRKYAGEVTFSVQGYGNLVSKLEHMVNIKLLLILKIYHDPTDATPNPESINMVKWDIDFQKSLREDYKKLWEFGNNSDVTLHIYEDDDEGKEFKSFKAHRAILAARSPVFQAMFENEMIEQTSGEIKIKDMHPVHVEIMLHFIYTGELLPSWKIHADSLTFAAEKYQLSDLTRFMDHNMVAACTSGNAIELLNCAKICKLQKAEVDVKKYIQRNLDSFLNALML